MANKKFKVVIVLGEQAQDAYAWEDMRQVCSLVRRGDCDVICREFNTEDERKAYIRGIDDMDGWFSAVVLSEKDAKKKCVKNLLVERYG